MEMNIKCALVSVLRAMLWFECLLDGESDVACIVLLVIMRRSAFSSHQVIMGALRWRRAEKDSAWSGFRAAVRCHVVEYELDTGAGTRQFAGFSST